MIGEAFSGKLMRVLKNISRKRGDGSTVSHKQAFYVKKASPGDVYDHGHAKLDIANMGNAPAESSEELSDQEPSAPVRASFAVEVQPLEIPWLIQGVEPDAVDPVPPEIRKRFDPDSRHLRVVNPVNANVPVFSVQPGEDMLWGSIEQELLMRLQAGAITALLPSSSAGGTALMKIESTDGYTERAYIRFDKLYNKNKKLYAELYGLDEEGAGPRKASAAYELAKVVGLDDIVPPTVCRYDEHNGLEPILPTDILADLAAHLGVGADAVREYIGKFATVELWKDGGSLFVDQRWYRDLVSVDVLNDPFSVLPSDIKIAFLRTAVFDLLTWNGSRTWLDLTFYDDERHVICVRGNEISFPDPRALAALCQDYPGSYADGFDINLQYMPMLWSDPVVMAVLRGFDREAEVFEKIAVNCTSRLRGDRVADLIRALSDRQVAPVSIAATLARVAMMRVGARSIMKDPLIIPRYYLSLVTGQEPELDFDIDLQAMEQEIDDVMSRALIGDFSFRAEMNEASDGDGQ